jgi:hypothetical protein
LSSCCMAELPCLLGGCYACFLAILMLVFQHMKELFYQ